MRIVVDLTNMPPHVELHDADDFSSFKVVTSSPGYAYVPVKELERLARDRTSDPEWRTGFEAMLAYAQAHDWLRDGAVRAHVESETVKR